MKVTEQEELQLQKLANDRSVTVARLLFEAATGTLPTFKNKLVAESLQGVQLELRDIGTALRTTVFTDTDLDETMRVIRELDDRMTAWLQSND